MASLNVSIPLVVTALLCIGDTAAHVRGPAMMEHNFAANAAISVSPSIGVEAPKPTKSTTRIAKAPDGLFYVSATIKKTQVRFLVDTGANLVVLTADDARRIGLPTTDEHLSDRMETAAGQAPMDRVSLDHMLIAGHDVYDVDAAVVRTGLKVSLLGQNLLSKLGPITISGDEIAVESPN